MQSQPTTTESLDHARALLRELIDRAQADATIGQAPPPTSLLRIIVHVANIQKSVNQSGEDPANAAKRLRDFANTIDQLDSCGEGMADAQDIRNRLSEVLRLAANQLGVLGAGAIRGLDDEPAPVS